MESVKINSLEIENVKRVRAVKIVPTQNGLTVLGGRNNQGKTSILDSIACACWKRCCDEGRCVCTALSDWSVLPFGEVRP